MFLLGFGLILVHRGSQMERVEGLLQEGGGRKIGARRPASAALRVSSDPSMMSQGRTA